MSKHYDELRLEELMWQYSSKGFAPTDYLHLNEDGSQCGYIETSQEDGHAECTNCHQTWDSLNAYVYRNLDDADNPLK